MKILLVACLCATSLFSGSACSSQPAFAVSRVMEALPGTVSSISKGAVSLTMRDGSTRTVSLVADPKIYLSFPTQPDRIVAGCYIASFNRPRPGEADLASEIRVYSPSVDPRLIENRVDVARHMMSTKNKVLTATSRNGSEVLTVADGLGERQLQVPAGTSITYVEPTSARTVRSIKVGTNVSIVTSFANGKPDEQAITVAQSDISSTQKPTEDDH